MATGVRKEGRAKSKSKLQCSSDFSRERGQFATKVAPTNNQKASANSASLR